MVNEIIFDEYKEIRERYFKLKKEHPTLFKIVENHTLKIYLLGTLGIFIGMYPFLEVLMLGSLSLIGVILTLYLAIVMPLYALCRYYDY